MLEGFARATARGYDDAIAHPAAALADLVKANPGLKGPVAKAQLDAYLPLFEAGVQRFGVIQTAGITALSGFLTGAKLVPEPFTAGQFVADVGSD